MKPANVKLRSDGTVKVLDFGLAKALDQVSGVRGQVSADHAGSPANSATITSPAMTQMGVILGTAAYMSPEQAKGKPADRRSDIWAFGCVVYEMLAGRRAFDGEDISDTLANVLKSDPSWSRLPASTPSPIVALIRRCLRKDPARRLQHIGDARIEIDDSRHAPREVHTDSSRVRRHERLLWATAVIGVALLAGALAVWLGRSSPPSEWRVDIVTPPSNDAASFALSPDGKQIAFTAQTGSDVRLCVRGLDGSGTRALTGTDDARMPFWSPGGRSIAFFAGTRLKRIDLESGEVRALANVITPAGGAWSATGTIVFTPNSADVLFRVDAAGGPATPLTRSDRRGEHFPQFLPDGRHFVYHASETAVEPAGVYVDDLLVPGPRRVAASDAAPVYTSGHLLLVRQNALLAQPFDVSTLESIGSATRIVDNVTIGGTNKPAVAAASTGMIAFRTGVTAERRQLVWMDRKGQRLREVGDQNISPRNPQLSRDGNYVAFQDNPNGNTDVWLLDLAREVPTRFTSELGIDALPVWAPDDTRLIFISIRSSGPGLYVQGRDGAPAQQVLPSPPPDVMIACDWSPDGRFVLYKDLDTRAGAYDLRVLPMNPPGPPVSVAATSFDERDGQFSPDGRWIAFQSDETGRPEIYVQSFPEAVARIRVSKDGGTQVRWNRTGKELFYVDAAGRLMAVPITTSANGQLSVGAPTPLFTIRVPPAIGVMQQQYAVSSDGNRFLVSVIRAEGEYAPISLILNWKPVAQSR